MEISPQTPQETSVVHAMFIRRCIHIANHYGSDLALSDHETLRGLPETAYTPHTTVGKRYTARMPHLPFANRWQYTAYNQQGTDLMQHSSDRWEHAPIGEVQVTHMSMGQPTATSVDYAFGNNRRVYAHASIDGNQPPTPSVRAFMEQVGVPIYELDWNSPGPYGRKSWNSKSPLSAIHVLAIMRVVNSHFNGTDTSQPGR